MTKEELNKKIDDLRELFGYKFVGDQLGVVERTVINYRERPLLPKRMVCEKIDKIHKEAMLFLERIKVEH